MIWKKRRVYADAAAATPLSPRAKKELVRLLDLYGNPSALHLEAQEAKHELELARERVARAVGAHADEIVFTSGGTEANNLAIEGVLRPLLHEAARGGVHAITSVIEHPSVLEPMRVLMDEGLELTELPVNSSGVISVSDVQEVIRPETAFVSIQMVNSEIGSIQPIKEIAKVIRQKKKELNLPQHHSLSQDAPFQKMILPRFHCDASQAPLWKTIRVDALGVDLLTLDGQKIMGPKGVGILYVRRGTVIEPQTLGGGQERGVRSGTENVPLASAFAVALEDSQKTEDSNAKKIKEVRNFLVREILRYLPNAEINGAVGDERVANNLNISIPHLDGEMAVIALSALGVAASTRSACDSSQAEPSHVLTALELSPSRIKSAIRLTLLPTATEKEASSIAKKLHEVAKRYEVMS